VAQSERQKRHPSGRNRSASSKKTRVSGRSGVGVKAPANTARNKVFPVVVRIREEIDFCFSSFYGDLEYDKRVCDRAFNKWVERGYRGPGELTIYIEMLVEHLSVPTQQSIFRNLANDCITLVKKNRKSPVEEGFVARHKFQLALNIGILLLLIAVFYLGKISSG